MKLRYIGGPGKHKEEEIKLISDLQPGFFGMIVEYPVVVNQSHWWLAEEDGWVVGFTGLFVYDDESTGFLNLSALHKNYRGKGFQRRMVSVREQKAKKLGVERLITYTSHDNMPSANNLIKCGYRLYIPRWDWGVKNALYFRKFMS